MSPWIWSRKYQLLSSDSRLASHISVFMLIAAIVISTFTLTTTLRLFVSCNWKHWGFCTHTSFQSIERWCTVDQIGRGPIFSAGSLPCLCVCLPASLHHIHYRLIALCVSVTGTQRKAEEDIGGHYLVACWAGPALTPDLLYYLT